MRTAVYYTRVSTREQEEEGFSLAAQFKSLQDYAKRHDLKIVKAFEDVYSAKKAGRKQFNEMVKWLEKTSSCRVLLVEKTDRLYRNLADKVTIDNLDIELHLVREGQVISKEARSQTKFAHGINVVVAQLYSDNLSDEARKGMREKASQGIFPGRAPFGYRNNKAERTIEIDPLNSQIVAEMMELYATGQHSALTLQKLLKSKYSKRMSRSNINLILKNRFYIGEFVWSGETWPGTHPLFLDRKVFARVQAVLSGQNRSKYSKRDIAFRGLMTCANDGCMLTGDVQKEKYVYYRCTGNRGKCELPRFTERVISDRMGEPLKDLKVTTEIIDQIVAAQQDDQDNKSDAVNKERSRLAARLTQVRNRMEAVYTDKVDGKVTEEFWQRKMSEWQSEEAEVKVALAALAIPTVGGLALSSEEISDLSSRAYSLYLRQDPAERAKLLKMMCSNISVDAHGITPSFRYPFNLILPDERWEPGRSDAQLPCATLH